MLVAHRWLRFDARPPRHWIGPIRYDMVNDRVLWLEPA